MYINRTIPEQRRTELTDEQRLEIVKRYQSLEPMIDIAKSLHITRQCVFYILKKAGINTSKEQRIERICPTCGKTVKKTRAIARQYKQSFCNDVCYHTWLETLGEAYNPSSYHSRISREIVHQYFDYRPEEGHILHHIDKDCTNYRKMNLMVFANQGDHVRYHRGFQATPIWDGRIH